MPSDEDLLAQIRAGSEHAFEELYERYEKRIYAFIYHRVTHRQDADEIFQDAMLAIVKHRDTEFSLGGFAPWIYKVSLNLCLNKRRRKNLIEVDGDIDRSIDPSDPPDVLFLNKQREQIVRRAVENLPETLSQVYLLWADGHSYEEMAEKSKLPVGTVKSRIHTAITRIRQEIKS